MRTALFGRIALACTPFGRPRLRVPEAATICERHPLLVTVPIGAWMSSIAFDALSATGRIEDERMYAAGAKTLIDIGIASAAAASAFGLLDFLRVPRGARAPLATVLAAVRHLG